MRWSRTRLPPCRLSLFLFHSFDSRFGAALSGASLTLALAGIFTHEPLTFAYHNTKTPMKKITPLLVTLTFTFACFSLWAILTAVSNLSPSWSQPPPAFTRLCLSLSPILLVLPIPVIAYCIFALTRKTDSPESGIRFIASSMTALCLVFFPVLLAILLPCFQLLEAK
jgi:hypothetical protein